jgi:hypothetical protein
MRGQTVTIRNSWGPNWDADAYASWDEKRVLEALQRTADHETDDARHGMRKKLTDFVKHLAERVRSFCSFRRNG